jgi:hypothetical protein
MGRIDSDNRNGNEIPGIVDYRGDYVRREFDHSLCLPKEDLNRSSRIR